MSNDKRWWDTAKESRITKYMGTRKKHPTQHETHTSESVKRDLNKSYPTPKDEHATQHLFSGMNNQSSSEPNTTKSSSDTKDHDRMQEAQPLQQSNSDARAQETNNPTLDESHTHEPADTSTHQQPPPNENQHDDGKPKDDEYDMSVSTSSSSSDDSSWTPSGTGKARNVNRLSWN